MAYQDVYELIDRQLLSGQEVLNVYFYFNNNTLSGSADAQDMIDSFIGQILPKIRPLQTPDINHIEVSARNLFDASDRAVNAISLPGSAVAGDYFNNFSATGISLIQDNGAVKNGAKRIACLPESVAQDGVINDATFIALLATLEAALFGTLDFGIISTWLPVIIKRILVSPGVYRLPENSGELVYGSVVDAQFSPLVTSQTSRKVGVGI